MSSPPIGLVNGHDSWRLDQPCSPTLRGTGRALCNGVRGEPYSVITSVLNIGDYLGFAEGINFVRWWAILDLNQ